MAAPAGLDWFGSEAGFTVRKAPNRRAIIVNDGAPRKKSRNRPSAGAIRKLTLGNSLTETAAYNSRVQPCRMNVNSSGSSLTNCTDAVPSGNIQDLSYGFNSGASNNGNLASMTATGAQAFNRSYTYDSVNRLATMNQSSGSATSCSSSYGLSWTYDIWGNRTDQTVTSGTCNASHVSVNTKNQLVDPVNNIYQYDAAGKLTRDGPASYHHLPR